MKLSTLVVAFLVVLPVAAEDTKPPGNWQSEWKGAFRSAREQRRLVLVDYFATWCGPCKLMDATVFTQPGVQQRLSDFVLLRIDGDKNFTALGHGVSVYPTFIVYDPDERELFRIIGSREADAFTAAIDEIRGAAPRFLSASDLLGAGKRMDAQLLIGNTYTHLHMTGQARTAYDQARKAAEQQGDHANAQLAEALSALTFAREGNPSRAIKTLQKLATRPVDRTTESLIWLTLGNAFQIASDPHAAVEAYRHSQTLSTPDSAAYKEATAAMAKMQ